MRAATAPRFSAGSSETGPDCCVSAVILIMQINSHQVIGAILSGWRGGGEARRGEVERRGGARRREWGEGGENERGV